MSLRRELKMDYTPVTAVWEITNGCNMRCNHCGSSCEDARKDELTTEEALNACDDMGRLGMKWITLSGGEPLTRKDWPLLAGRLFKNGIIPNIITNGWLVNDTMVRIAEENGVETISISLDGIKETHDGIRKKGSYDKVISAFKTLDTFNHMSGANTTVTKHNIGELDQIKEILLQNRVKLWQIQIGLPMGNLAKTREKAVDPEVVDYLLDYSYKTTMEGKIKVFPADCLGYFTSREVIVRQMSMGSSTPVLWQGCNAGKRSFGLLHNGDVLGCTSIRDKSFIEGNIRMKSLYDIWHAPNSFSWSRNMDKAQLSGGCQECVYGNVCLGGCPNTRLTFNGSIYSENQYCAYNLAMKKTRANLNTYDDAGELLTVARSFADQQKWQLAALSLERAKKIDPSNIDILALDGFVNFHLENYSVAETSNKNILTMDPNNGYALKGMGLTLHKLNRSDEGIGLLKKATEQADSKNMDSFLDLSIVYNELGRRNDAIKTLERAESLMPGYISSVYPFYAQLKQSS